LNYQKTPKAEALDSKKHPKLKRVQEGGNSQTILKAKKSDFFPKIGFLDGLKISALQH